MRTLLLFIILCLPLQASAFNPMVVGGNATTTPATVCTSYDEESTGGDTQLNVGGYNTKQLGGITWIDSVQANDICQVDFYVHDEIGDPSVNDYWVEIWTMSGDNLDTFQARSAKVDGVNGWSDVWVTFTFNTPFTAAQNTEYAILIKMLDTGDAESGTGEYDNSNYINLRYDDEGDDTAKQIGKNAWNSATGATTDSRDDEDDVYVKIYTMQ